MITAQIYRDRRRSGGRSLRAINFDFARDCRDYSRLKNGCGRKWIVKVNMILGAEPQISHGIYNTKRSGSALELGVTLVRRSRRY
jgi:hypothetical protein